MSCSPFCLHVMHQVRTRYPLLNSVIDLGSNTGRDVFHGFRKRSFDATLRAPDCDVVRERIEPQHDNFPHYYDVFYSRSDVHALPYSDISLFLSNVHRHMVVNHSVFFIETHSIVDTEYDDGVSRYAVSNFKSPIGGGVCSQTLLRGSHLIELCEDARFDIVHFQEGGKKKPDPPVIRMELQKMINHVSKPFFCEEYTCQ